MSPGVRFLQKGQHVGGVGVRLYLRHDALDAALLVNEEGGAHHAHRGFAVQLLFLPHAVGFYGLPFRVGKQQERQAVLFCEFLVRGLGILAYAITTAFRFWNSSQAAAKAQACRVQPGVLSLG